MSFVGATLKFSPSVSPSNVAPKYSAILSGVLEETKRPHMAATLARGCCGPSTPPAREWTRAGVRRFVIQMTIADERRTI